MDKNIVWKDIKEYEGLYQVSNFGDVYSLKRNLILKPRNDKDGYLRINLCKESKQTTFSIHRLVALMFIPNIHNLDTINHKDGNKTNNYVENLEWCTIAENNEHAINMGLNKGTYKVGESCYNAKFTDSDIYDIRNSGLSRKELAEKYNTSEKYIGKIQRYEKRKFDGLLKK